MATIFDLSGSEEAERDFISGSRLADWRNSYDGQEQAMTYYEAALAVLRSARRPLTTNEITDLALERKLIVPRGKTPLNTMAAALYKRADGNSELVKTSAPGGRRARRGSVRWTVRAR